MPIRKFSVSYMFDLERSLVILGLKLLALSKIYAEKLFFPNRCVKGKLDIALPFHNIQYFCMKKRIYFLHKNISSNFDKENLAFAKSLVECLS